MKTPDTLRIETLSGDWCDKDVVMLHACFQLLTDCIEDEKLLTGNTDWEHDAEHRSARKEIEALYAWWNERKDLVLQDKVDDLGTAQYEIDDQMLMRLIKVRKYLWT